jgi:hypothetical protein
VHVFVPIGVVLLKVVENFSQGEIKTVKTTLDSTMTGRDVVECAKLNEVKAS